MPGGGERWMVRRAMSPPITCLTAALRREWTGGKITNISPVITHWYDGFLHTTLHLTLMNVHM